MKLRVFLLVAVAMSAALLLGNAAAQPAVIATIPVGPVASPYGVAANPLTNRIYVTNVHSSTVSVIDGATNTVVETVSFPWEVAPFGVAVNPATNRIYVASPAKDALSGGDDTVREVSVIDGATNTLMGTIPVEVLPSAVAANPTTNRIYVANFASGTVSVIDGATDTVVATVPVGAGVLPWGVAVNPATNRIYVAQRASDYVSVIDGATNSVVATVPVGGGSWDVAVNPTTNRIYATDRFGTCDKVWVIDGATNTVAATVTVAACPEGVDVNPTTNRIYVSSPGSNVVSVIDGATDTVVATVPVGSEPEGVAANPTTNRIYVANGGDNSVSVIDDSDFDSDGCADSHEWGSNPALGGTRNPLNLYDFYDVPVPTAFNGGTLADRDQAVSIINDVLAVLEYAGTSDGGLCNSGPDGIPGTPDDRCYNQDNNGDTLDDGVLYDRSVGALWSDAPDGAINILADVLLVLAQSGHSCQADP